MMGPHTSTEGNVTQAVLPRSNLCSSAFQDGLVQNNAQVISSGMASSNNILVSQNVLQQNNTWAALPKNSFSCSMIVPQTITQGSNIQAPIPSSKLLSSPLHEGLVQSNPQEILPDVAFSNNSTMPQNIPMQYPKNQLKHTYMLIKPNQQITQASEELGQNNTHATRSKDKFCIKIMVPHTSTKESNTQVALPKNSFSCSMTVPQTITQGSNIQAPIPSSKLLSSPLHDGLVQSNPQDILPDVAFSNNSTMPQNIPVQYPENQLKHTYLLMKPNQQITQASEELGQNNTHTTRSKDKFCIKIMVPHTSTKESDTQVALPRSNVCSSAFQDGLVQNNAQVISSGMASSNNILVSQNVLQQNNTWTALPKNRFSSSMTVPQTITQGSNKQAPIPSNKLLNSPLHNGLVQNNPQEILRDVTFSNNSTMPQNIPMQYPENQLKLNYMVVKPNQQITQASEELGQNNTHATRSKDKFCIKIMVPHTSTKESNTQVALPKNSFSCSMTVPQTITQGSNIQAPIPSSKLLSSPLHDGLVQSNPQEILPDVAFSNNSTMPQNIPMQYPKNHLKLILVVKPNQQIALGKNIRMRVPHTVATESNIQVHIPNNMLPLSLMIHDGLAQSNPQEILPGVASSNNNPMLQNIREQNNSPAALLKNKFSSSMKVPWTIAKESNIQAPVSKNKLGNPLWHDLLQRDALKVLPGMAFHSNRVATKAVAVKTSTLADLPKNNSCIQHFQDQQNKFDISGKYQKMTSTMPTHPVVWKNGQIVKENEYLKSDCVFLSSSTSNRQLVLTDRAKNVLKSVKHISKLKSLAELSTPLSKASTENMIENREVSSALETSSMVQIKLIHAIPRKDGQDVKENQFFKSVGFHRNIPAKEAPSESDYVSLSLSNAWSSNRQPVIEDGVKNSSVKKSLAELNTSHLKASTTENMIENKEISGEQKASNMQQTSTMSIQPVVRKDGQDMKENKSLKSVRFNGNTTAGEAPSEPNCVSLPSSNACSNNRQPVIDDGVKNSSVKKSVAELDTSHLKASTTENMIENKEVSGEQKASNKKQTSTMSFQSVVRKDGQDVKENKSLKSVRFHGNIAAGETTSEPDCVSLPSSDACSSNRQLVFDDGVKNSSVKKSVAELDTSHLKASTTENMIENKVSGEQRASNKKQTSTMSIQSVVRKDGQDVKENKSLKSVRFHGNTTAGEAPSEPDCVSLPSSNACSNNRQPVIDDGIKNSSVKKSVAELDTSHLKASTTENMIENKEVSGEQKASNKKQTSTMSFQSVVRKDGQDVKENTSLKLVSFHGNMAAGKTTSEPDCVSLPSSDACSSNRQLVIDDGVKNSSIKKSLASTKNIIENKEVSGEQQGSSTAGSDTDDEVLVIRECKSGANKCIDVVCHVCTSLVTVEKMLDMHLLFGQLKCKNCNLKIACCNMMKTYFYGNSFCSGNKHQGIHDFTVWCSDVIEYILYQLRRDLIIKNFCKYDRNIPVCDNDLYSELQDYVEKLAILRKYRPWNSALLDCDQFILSQKMSRKTYSVSNTNTHLTDSAVENSSKADLPSFQDSHSLEINCKKKETEKDLERDKAEYVRIKRKRVSPRLVASEWDFPKDKRYLKISVTGKSFSCPEECPECYFAICPSRFIMKVNDFTLKYTCVECHLPMFFVFESDEERCKKKKRVN